MSSEEKASNPNPGNNRSESDVEPVEAQLADSTPLAEQAVNTGAEEPIEASVADAEQAGPEKSQITQFFNDNQGTPQGASVAMAAAAGKISLEKFAPPPLAKNLQNLSANGGAVGALVLGIWCFLGSFITNWSILNGILGLLLGAWGLTSQRKRMAWVGIVLCTVGILLCLAEFSELINQWWYAVDDTVG